MSALGIALCAPSLCPGRHHTLGEMCSLPVWRPEVPNAGAAGLRSLLWGLAVLPAFPASAATWRLPPREHSPVNQVQHNLSLTQLHLQRPREGLAVASWGTRRNPQRTGKLSGPGSRVPGVAPKGAATAGAERVNG